MAEVTLHIGGRQYDVHCRDGDENHLHALAARVNDKAVQARRNTPGLNEVRQLLFTSILLADELHDLASAQPRQASLGLETTAEKEADETKMAERINALAARIEALSQKLAP